jgi:iron uptake system component EfeO
MKPLALVVISAAVTGCSDKSDAEFRAEVIDGIHASIGAELDNLVKAAHDLQDAAPDHAWDTMADAFAMAQMHDAWRRARIAYEHVEGATAPLFPELDLAMDSRYDDLLERIGPAGDPDLFDATGVVGMHAVERILYSQRIRPEIIAFESSLSGYVPAAYPATAGQAVAFKAGLAGRVVDDATALHDLWQPTAIDIGAAYQGLVGLMNEQKLKIGAAATRQEESRYANITLFDMRNNLSGTKGIYDSFRPWIQARAMTSDDAIEVRFRALTMLYGAPAGDALPSVPSTWRSDAPTPADLATPFGVLWQAVQDNVDPGRADSIVADMNRVAVTLGFPEFVAD